MSKAFTREDDSSQDLPLSAPRAPLPPGVKNYLTIDGAEKFRAEAARLTQERAALGDSPEAKDRVLRLDLRLRHLEEILISAVVVETPPAQQDTVRFGAFVKVHDRSGHDLAYRIVGIDEADIDRDWISWQSPLARALLNKRVGETATFRTPAGSETLTILAISYQE
jgi:transcription elongation factor GreB